MRRLLALVSSLVCVLLLAAALAPRVAAQNVPTRGGVQPMAQQPPPPYSVSVTPDGTTEPERPANSGPYRANFTVTNTGTLDDEYEIHCSQQAPVTCNSVSPEYIALSPGQSTTVRAWYSVGGAGQGRVTVTALPVYGDIPDSGYRIVPVAGAQGPPNVVLRNFNGDNQDRSQCLTVGAGQAAGLACGDLFVTHGLPAYRTMGRDRSLTLFYSSHQATPRPTVTVLVSQPSGQQTPNSVYVELKVGRAIRSSATYAPWSSASGPMQLVLAYDASGDTSRLVPFTLEVRNQYTGGNYSTTICDTLIVVNRVGSEFGAGWWVAGVEQLVLNQPGNKILWLGGDGSAAVYRRAGTDATWARAAGAFRDTLVLASGVYTRTLRHGVQVKFNSAGRHIQTVNRTGQTTTFTWAGSPARLTGIRVPPGASGPTYTIAYDGSNKLDYITDPAGRVLNATVSGGSLTQLTDPDTHGVSFGYDGARRMTSRTGRRGFATSYTYANALRVTAVRVPLTATDTSVTALEWWDEKGLAIGTPTGTFYSADTLNAFSRVYGPRVGVDDDATFWVDRWGAPVRVVGAANDTSVLTRDAATGLVTRMRSPVGQILLMTYGARGNLLTLQDSTFDATGSGTGVSTTLYHYAPGTPDSPDSVIDPSGVVTRYEYNTLGLLSRAFSPNGHVTSFIYQLEGALAGLLQSVTDSAVQVVIDTSNWNQTTAHLTTQFTYNALGNDSLLVSPSGNTTIQARDAYQRVQYQTDPAGHRVGYSYSPMNWPTVVTEHLEDQGGGDSLQVARYFHNVDGAVDSLLTPVDSSGTRRDLPRRWVYDYANRQIAMIDDYGAVDSVFLDRAGQPDSVRTRRNWKIRYRYDAAGRVGSVWWPSTGWALGDSISFIYDQAGRLLTGLSRAGTLRRSYWRSGLLKTDSLVRSGGSTLPQWYRYDVSGRRAWYFNGLDTVTYVYGAVTGDLSSVQVNWQGAIPSDSVVFAWDALGRRRSVRYTNGTLVTYAYDRAGILRLVCSVHPGGGSNDALDFRVGVLSTDRDGQPTRREHERTHECGGSFGSNYLSNDSSAYDGRHRLVHQALRRPTPPEHDYWYTYDVSGNMTWRVDSIGPVSERYLVWPGHNRVYGWSLQGAFQLHIGSDSSGNRRSETPADGTPPERLRFFYYDASERLTGSGFFAGATWYDDRNKCLFDALGRRVNGCDPGLTEWITYDGDNVARTLGGWRYVHGPGLDDPLLGLFQSQGVDANKYYFVTDGAGRALVVADTGGVEQSSSMASSAGATTNAHTFQAQRAPATGAILSGLSFFRNRYYDQRTARWTQEDPIGPAGGTNLYAYVGNNPATYTDPFGLCPYGQKNPDSNVDDCPKDKLGNSFRLLSRLGGAEGAQVIHTIAANRVSVNLKSGSALERTCGSGTSGCAGGNTITMDGSVSSADIATRITHEATHVRMAGSGASYPVQEPIAWHHALNVYGLLRGPLGQSAFYESPFTWRQGNPAGFDRATCEAANRVVGGHTPC